MTKRNLALSIDIEDWYHIPSVTGSPFAQFSSTKVFFASFEGNYDYLTEPTLRTLKILKERDLKATFFIVAEVVDKYPGLVEKITKDGHEIGCHGLHHELYYYPKAEKMLKSKKKFKRNMKKAKEILESATNQEVIGFRVPAAYVTGWMLDILENLGFRYDSSVSVNSLYNKTSSSLKGVDSRPYYPKHGELIPSTTKRDILEFPWPFLKIGRILLPSCGGPFLRFFGSKYINLGLKQSLRRGPTCFYFHPLDISYTHFPDKFNSKRPFYWAIKGRIVEERVKKLLTIYKDRISTFHDIFSRISL